MLRPNEALGGMDPGLAKSSMVPSKPGLKTLNPPRSPQADASCRRTLKPTMLLTVCLHLDRGPIECSGADVFIYFQVPSLARRLTLS